MADDRLRALRRRFEESGQTADEAALLRAEVRAGRVGAEQLALAAYLGHPAAVEAHEGQLPTATGEGWERTADSVALLGRWGPQALYRAGAALVRAIPIRSDRFDGPDDRLLEVMDLLEDWILQPDAETRARLEVVPEWLGETLENAWGAAACVNAAERLFRAIEEPEAVGGHLRALTREARGLYPHEVTVALQAELVPWALGRGDPLVERRRVGGNLLGRVDGLVRGIVCRPGRAFVVDSRGRLSEWDLEAGALRREVGQFGHDVYAFGALRDGWVGSDPSGRLRWLGERGADLGVASDPLGQGIGDLTVVDDDLVAVACSDGSVQLHRLTPGGWEAEAAWEAHPGGAVTVDARGGRLLSGGRDGTAQVWDLAGAPQGPRLEHPDRVAEVCWLDDARLVTSSDDTVVRGWRLGEEAPRWADAQLQRSVHALVAWDGRWVSAAGGDGSVRTWDAEGRQVRLAWPRGTLLCAAHAADGRLLVGARKGTLRIYPAI